MAIDNELIDSLLKNYKKPEDLIGENGLLKQLTKQLLERAMAAERPSMGYEKHDAEGDHSGNSRMGSRRRQLRERLGLCRCRCREIEMGLLSHRYREASDAVTGFDDNIISLYARDCRPRDPAAPGKIYQVEVSPALISNVTEEVIEDVREWQNGSSMKSIRSCIWTLCIQGEDGGTSETSGVLAIGVKLSG